jgi:hypothetical protein
MLEIFMFEFYNQKRKSKKDQRRHQFYYDFIHLSALLKKGLNDSTAPPPYGCPQTDPGRRLPAHHKGVDKKVFMREKIIGSIE